MQEKNEPKTACELLEERLTMSAQLRKQWVGGGAGIGMSTSGNPVITVTGSDQITSYDKDTNDLVRTKYACEKNMVVSPFSTSKNILFTKPEQYEAQRKDFEQQRLQDKEKKCIIQ